MILAQRQISVRQLYRSTAAVAVLGSLAMLVYSGWRPALAFLLGSLISLGNLWLFARLARGIEPGDRSRKPWQAGAFFARYLIFFTFGYVIVRSLGVSPLPVVLGLFASTAAVLLSSAVELTGNLFEALLKQRRN